MANIAAASSGNAVAQYGGRAVARPLLVWLHSGNRSLCVGAPARSLVTVCLAEEGERRKTGRHTRRFWMSRNDAVMMTRASDLQSNDNAGFPDVKKKRWFPYKDHFKVDEQTGMTSAMVIETLTPLLVDGRKQKFESIVASRTFSICPVVEGLFDIGNISAVFRTAEAFGLQSVHVISNNQDKKYKEGRNISMGTEKWLDVEVWDTTRDCIEVLKARGYRIAVTDIGADTVPIHEVDWTVPTAVIFGNEHRGISEEAISSADIKCSIPITGMVDSFNVSVAAGILMYHVVNDRLARAGVHGDLTPEEQQILCAEFHLRHKRNINSILDYLIARKREGDQSEIVHTPETMDCATSSS